MKSHVRVKHKEDEALRMHDSKGQRFLESNVVSESEKKEVGELLQKDQQGGRTRRSKEGGTMPVRKKGRAHAGQIPIIRAKPHRTWRRSRKKKMKRRRRRKR